MSKPLIELENKINNLNKIDSWENKIIEIKQIKIDIETENENINKILLTLDNPTTKIKEYNIDKIINDFDNCDLSKKIKYYHSLNNYIKNIEKLI